MKDAYNFFKPCPGANNKAYCVPTVLFRTRTSSVQYKTNTIEIAGATIQLAYANKGSPIMVLSNQFIPKPEDGTYTNDDNAHCLIGIKTWIND
ncbi:MAG TPA: hypothetical protein VJ111_10325 [Chitinophagaceae bacterium]|nr:hypothetical protein [Chitinophagaceae bacterium]